MPDETQNPSADAPAGDAAAPTTDAAMGEAAVGADVGDVGEDEFNPPNTIIYRTPSGEEEIHVSSETGQDDFIVKPSGEIVRKDGRSSGFDEYIEGGDEFNPPNTIIYRTPSGEEEIHVSSETGQDDFIVKPSGEIVRKYEGSGWDEYIEAKDVVEPMEDPAANAVYEGVETPPSFMMEDTFEGGDLGNVGEEDVIEPMDDPVVDP